MIKFIIMIKYKQGQALPSGVTLGPLVKKLVCKHQQKLE